MIKTIVVSLVFAGVAFMSGYQAGSADTLNILQDRIETLEFNNARFENKYVFDHARKVSDITGADLHQVLTGKRGSR